MHQLAKRIIGWGAALFVVLCLLLVGAWYGLHAWLESAGGKQALADAISKRTGISVELGTEFHVVLYPVIGAGGDGLRVNGREPGQYVLQSDSYQVSVALAPLWDGQVVIEEIRLSDGTLDLSQLPELEPGGDAGGKNPAALPEIEVFQVSRFQVIPAKDAEAVAVENFRLAGFSAGQWSEVELGVEDLGRLEARLRLDSSVSLLELDALAITLIGQQLTGRACLERRNPPALAAYLGG